MKCEECDDVTDVKVSALVDQGEHQDDGAAVRMGSGWLRFAKEDSSPRATDG